MHSATHPIPSASPDDPKKQNLGSRDKSKSTAKDEDTAGIPPPAESSVYESSVFTDADASILSYGEVDGNHHFKHYDTRPRRGHSVLSEGEYRSAAGNLFTYLKLLQC